MTAAPTTHSSRLAGAPRPVSAASAAPGCGNPEGPDGGPARLAPDIGAQPRAPALAFRDISMRWADGSLALDRASLTLSRSEFVSVIGPSGCGKSTLLRIASGLQRQSGGEVLADRSRLGHSFQDATLLPWRRILGNVELPLELRGQSAPGRRRLAAERLAQVGLAGFERHYPRQLSGGMRMRAALARALVTDPEVFLLDEPFGALDELTREQLNALLMALYLERGFAALLVTHSIAEAVQLSGRVLVMGPRPGRIIAEFAVPFGWPRPPGLRYEPEFARLAGEISEALRGAWS